MKKLVSSRHRDRQEFFRSDQTRKLMTYLKLAVEGMVSVEWAFKYGTAIKAVRLTACYLHTDFNLNIVIIQPVKYNTL